MVGEAFSRLDPTQQRAMQELGEVGQSTAVIRGLIDPRHQVWYPGPQPNDIYWPAYRTYLETVKHWPAPVIGCLRSCHGAAPWC